MHNTQINILYKFCQIVCNKNSEDRVNIIPTIRVALHFEEPV